jgi:hypothetical protein
MRARIRLVSLFAIWLSPAALALDVSGCNDGSTGCCMVCPECACGDECISCATRCTRPKGCACGSMPSLREATIDDLAGAPMSVGPDAGARE